ncbi:MAG: hypothetical protein V7765_21485, partial [Oleispira sp.]
MIHSTHKSWTFLGLFLLLCGVIITGYSSDSKAVTDRLSGKAGEKYRTIEWTDLMPKDDLEAILNQPDYIDEIVDSPLASGFTEHYRELKYLWDKEAQRKVASGRHPLSFESLLTIDSHQEHEKLLGHLKESGRAAIVIAASGMFSGGRMQNYLQELLPDERTDVILVALSYSPCAGYCFPSRYYRC